MSKLHLTTGSKQPPKVDGKLRLYSMEYCPYARRARLVLNAKKIPHDIVNINLVNKPEWYAKVNPAGKVPALDTGSEVIVESLVIADYLDEKYPNPPLYPSDPAAKQHEKELIKKIDALTVTFHKCVAGGTAEKTPEEWAKEFAPHNEVFEKELAKKGTTFISGSQPGMVDYMLWPWGENTGLIAMKLGQRLPFAENQFPLMRKWRSAMRQHPVCAEIYTGAEKMWKLVQAKINNEVPDYDNL